MILSGTTLANSLRRTLAQEIAKQLPTPPGLAFLVIGEHPASFTYVRAKKKACAEVGIQSHVVHLPATASLPEVLDLIHRLNHTPTIHGILVQLPLPAHLPDRLILQAIHPLKDVDGFHPLNLGKLLLGEESGFIPCTPLGIHLLLQQTGHPIEGSHVVIVGRSAIVGKPLAALLMQKRAHCNATVTIAHSRSQQLTQITRSADILIAALGQPRFITQEMIKPGAIVIDVGIHRVEGKLIGDVDFDAVSRVASHISPVPGGVGPMTIAMLLQNTFKSALQAKGL